MIKKEPRYFCYLLTFLVCHCLFFYVISLATGQEKKEPLVFTLIDSVDYAHKHNLKIQSLIDKLDLRKKQLRVARPVGLPQVNLNSNYTYAKDLPKSIIDFGGNSPFPNFQTPMQTLDLQQVNGQTNGLQPPIPSEDVEGGTSITEMEFGAHHTFQGGLSLVQPLFSWGRYYYTYRSAKATLSASKSELAEAYNQLNLDVATAFYRLLLSMEFVKVSKQTVEFSNRQLEIAQDLLSSGASTNFDVIRAKVQVANAKSTYIRSKNAVNLAKDAFKNVLNLDFDQDIQVSGDFRYEKIDWLLDDLIEWSIMNRSDLQQIGQLKQAAQEMVKVTQATTRPSLSFLADYRVDDNEKLTEMNKVWNVGLALSFPIFDGLMTYYRVQEAKSAVSQLAVQHSQLEDGIQQEVRAAYLQILEAQSLMDVQKETVEQAKEGLRLADLQYKNGLITSVELTDAQLALTQSEVNRLQAQHDYSVALVRLEKAIGQSLSTLKEKNR